MQRGFSQMQGIGQDLMDPNSAMNVAQYGRMRTEGANQMALQALLGRRQAAATGADSGIMRAQQRAMQQNLTQSLGSQFGNMMQQNRMQGIGVLQNSQSLLGNIGKFQMGIDENVGQARVAERQWQMNEEMRQRKAKQEMYNIAGDTVAGIGTGYAKGGSFGN